MVSHGEFKDELISVLRDSQVEMRQHNDAYATVGPPVRNRGATKKTIKSAFSRHPGEGNMVFFHYF